MHGAAMQVGLMRAGVVMAMAGIALGAAAQAPAAASPVTATFAAVSVKPDQRRVAMHIQSDPAGVHATSITLRQLIVWAYNIQDDQLMGGGEAIRSRSWMQFEHFDVEASTSAPASDAQLRSMMQGVLATRFGLQIQRDEKPTPLLALVVAPGGVKFKAQSAAQGPPRIGIEQGVMVLPFQTPAQIVSRLNLLEMMGTRGLNRLFVDQTGLTGTYDIRVAIPTDESTGLGGRAMFRPHWDQVAGALKEVGLDLKPVTLPFTSYTIESAHEPAANQ